MSAQTGDVELTEKGVTKEEDAAFLPNGRKKQEEPTGMAACCRSARMPPCCVFTGVVGALFVILGIVALFTLKGLIEEKILKSMALRPGTDRTKSWLTPPVQPHLTAYAFHLTNPEAFLAGKKPILEERGPFVYKAVTIKDSDDNMKWNEKEGLLTYRPRKIYSYVPELSAEGFKDPNNAFITVPNIPFWTGLNKARRSPSVNIGLTVVMEHGFQPFVNVSINGLLWGYDGSPLPCVDFTFPEECQKESDKEVSFSDSDDDFKDDMVVDMDEKTPSETAEDGQSPVIEDEPDNFKPPEDSIWEPLVKPRAEYVNCQCNWGLFRDRNVTIRQPVTFFTGTSDLKLKGVVQKYNGKRTLGWWKTNSSCDAVKGQDAGTLPPGIETSQDLEIFIDLMCRTIKLEYEKDVEHAGIRSYRYIPSEKAMASHEDPDENKRNPDNECYCLKNLKFKCFKTGVLNMEPCKRDTFAPLALSYPHFYQADPSFLEAVGGLSPNKEKHQFFLDVEPEFGFPLAIRPRFQLNMVLFRLKELKQLNSFPEEIVMPFMWAEDGFGSPSEEMASSIAFGLSAPQKLSVVVAVLCFALGALLCAVSLGFFIWKGRSRSADIS